MKSAFRIALAVALVPILVLGLVWMMDARERRFALYEIMNSLKYSMPYPDVKRVVKENEEPYIQKTVLGRDEVLLKVTLGLAQEFVLCIRFDDGKLISAVMHGEDSPADRFPDQPQDILGPSGDDFRGG